MTRAVFASRFVASLFCVGGSAPHADILSKIGVSVIDLAGSAVCEHSANMRPEAARERDLHK